jgi:glycosyltransferase involved in cell wall biosynthesis
MHIVQALAALSIGGSEMVTAEITAYLRRRGHRVTVLGAPGHLSQRVRETGAGLLEWPVGRKRLSTLKYIGRFSKWLADNQPEIVHVHSRLPAWVCWRAIRRLAPGKRPVFITSMHGQYTVSAYSAVMTRGDRVIAVSDHIRNFTLENYDRTDPSRIVTIHGGTSRIGFPYGHRPGDHWYKSAYREFPMLRGKRILLLPGRLSRYKGHATFLELIGALLPDFPDMHGVIVGQARPGSRYMAELEGLAERAGVIDHITFTGLRPDMRDWMSAAEIVFNLCSDPPEAFGRIVPEALHLGIPVIGWDHGGVRETLARMFPQGAVQPDSRQELLAKTRSFLDQKPQVPDSDQFLLGDSMDRTMKLYESALGVST